MAQEETTAVAERNGRKTFEGVVVSDKMNKTRTVMVSRLVRHPFYEKVAKKSSEKYHLTFYEGPAGGKLTRTTPP